MDVEDLTPPEDETSRMQSQHRRPGNPYLLTPVSDHKETAIDVTMAMKIRYFPGCPEKVEDVIDYKYEA